MDDRFVGKWIGGLIGEWVGLLADRFVRGWMVWVRGISRSRTIHKLTNQSIDFYQATHPKPIIRSTQPSTYTNPSTSSGIIGDFLEKEIDEEAVRDIFQCPSPVATEPQLDIDKALEQALLEGEADGKGAGQEGNVDDTADAAGSGEAASGPATKRARVCSKGPGSAAAEGKSKGKGNGKAKPKAKAKGKPKAKIARKANAHA